MNALFFFVQGNGCFPPGEDLAALNFVPTSVECSTCLHTWQAQNHECDGNCRGHQQQTWVLGSAGHLAGCGRAGRTAQKSWALYDVLLHLFCKMRASRRHQVQGSWAASKIKHSYFSCVVLACVGMMKKWVARGTWLGETRVAHLNSLCCWVRWGRLTPRRTQRDPRLRSRLF